MAKPTCVKTILKMEGRRALRHVDVKQGKGFYLAFSFCLGAAVEWLFCKTGYYQSASFLRDLEFGGYQKYNEKTEDEEFWDRVQARRKGKAEKLTIKTDEK